MERSSYNLLRMRESLMRNCKEFQIPTDWMLDSGIISKVKVLKISHPQDKQFEESIRCVVIAG